MLRKGRLFNLYGESGGKFINIIKYLLFHWAAIDQSLLAYIRRRLE